LGCTRGRSAPGYGDCVRLTLASTSPARLALLRAAGVEPDLEPSDVDEPAAVAAAEAAVGRVLNTDEMVLLLAKAKAETVAERLLAAGRTDTLVLGGDSAFEIDGVAYGKPHTAENAEARWRQQRGRSGTLASGHWLIDLRQGATSGGSGAVATATVQFVDDVTDAELAAYIATGEPLEVAGAFTIDSLGGPFIERVEGDPSTVVGMSLSTVRRLVRSTGVEWTDLWAPRLA
jgi:septum formation protein